MISSSGDHQSSQLGLDVTLALAVGDGYEMDLNLIPDGRTQSGERVMSLRISAGTQSVHIFLTLAQLDRLTSLINALAQELTDGPAN